MRARTFFNTTTRLIATALQRNTPQIPKDSSFGRQDVQPIQSQGIKPRLSTREAEQLLFAGVADGVKHPVFSSERNSKQSQAIETPNTQTWHHTFTA